MMEKGVRRAAASGEISVRSVPALSRLLYGALCETAMAVARSGDPERELAAALVELTALFDGVRIARAADRSTPADETAGHRPVT
jgi:hypothetical protein